MTLEDEPPCQKVSSMLLGKSRGQLLIASERNEEAGPKENDTQLWMGLVVKVWCCKKTILHRNLGC